MYKSITTLDHSSALNQCYNAKKLIFFCGSGISTFPPSCLPMGNELLKTYIQQLENSVIQFGLPPTNLAELSKLPLETLTDYVVEDIEQPKYLETLNKIVKYFQDVTPNHIHYLIASFLINQSNRYVITTNYDLGIETAAKKCSRFSDSKMPFDVFGVKKLQTLNCVNRNSIFKIHGCALQDNVHDLIFTTKQESSGLPPNFVTILHSLFENSLVVFMGYSLSEPDSLEALMNVSNYEVIWVTRNIDKFIRKQNPRIQLILKQAKQASLLEDLTPLSTNGSRKFYPDFSNYRSRTWIIMHQEFEPMECKRQKNSF